MQFSCFSRLLYSLGSCFSPISNNILVLPGSYHDVDLSTKQCLCTSKLVDVSATICCSIQSSVLLCSIVLPVSVYSCRTAADIAAKSTCINTKVYESRVFTCPEVLFDAATISIWSSSSTAAVVTYGAGQGVSNRSSTISTPS